ncbi:aminoacyl-tRNA hydrolase [Geomicrobium sediminis]|uniref:Peptidyl-tRNA hydrolase n=1 Tax=Geomicrobium sediminis TaxID=1347788 RepID=A0ABS2PI95_9BACL|nr:aminoacyl-tRNA hydrolase [Geomicrobium sediminis]MBM7635154.1 PTH1 family peptidyl-tRNA hydrolase [Geomicrobium sediminis]
MKVIVGLGNPGRKYTKTRHNVGFMAIDDLAKSWGEKLKKHTNFRAEYTEVIRDGEKLILLKPLTFMNLSGESVRAVANYYDLDSEDILVVYDDLDLPAGTVKYRKSGGHGGHNGIRSLIDQLGTKQFNRARIGIDRPPEGKAVVDYVLSKFDKREMDAIQDARENVVRACETWVHDDFDRVMNQHN